MAVIAGTGYKLEVFELGQTYVKMKEGYDYKNMESHFYKHYMLNELNIFLLPLYNE